MITENKILKTSISFNIFTFKKALGKTIYIYIYYIYILYIIYIYIYIYIYINIYEMEDQCHVTFNANCKTRLLLV